MQSKEKFANGEVLVLYSHTRRVKSKPQTTLVEMRDRNGLHGTGGPEEVMQAARKVHAWVRAPLARRGAVFEVNL